MRALGWSPDGDAYLLVERRSCPLGGAVPDDRNGIYVFDRNGRWSQLFAVSGRSVRYVVP